MSSTKQSLKKPKGVVFKIFGVTTNRTFTKTLDEYFDSHLTNYLKTHWNNKKLLELLNKLSTESLERNGSVPRIKTIGPNIESTISSIKLYANYITKNKINNTLVYELKLYVWGEGYKNKKIRVPFYEDVPKALREWKTKKMKRYSFTSGTVEGQMVYFRNSTLGNLSDCVEGYITGKNPEMNGKEPETYTKIAQIMNEDVKDVLFLTDNIDEANVCEKSGMNCILVSRTDLILTSEQKQKFKVIKSFDEIVFI